MTAVSGAVSVSCLHSKPPAPPVPLVAVVASAEQSCLDTAFPWGRRGGILLEGNQGALYLLEVLCTSQRDVVGTEEGGGGHLREEKVLFSYFLHPSQFLNPLKKYKNFPSHIQMTSPSWSRNQLIQSSL